MVYLQAKSKSDLNFQTKLKYKRHVEAKQFANHENADT